MIRRLLARGRLRRRCARRRRGCRARPGSRSWRPSPSWSCSAISRSASGRPRPSSSSASRRATSPSMAAAEGRDDAAPRRGRLPRPAPGSARRRRVSASRRWTGLVAESPLWCGALPVRARRRACVYPARLARRRRRRAFDAAVLRRCRGRPGSRGGKRDGRGRTARSCLAPSCGRGGEPVLVAFSRDTRGAAPRHSRRRRWRARVADDRGRARPGRAPGLQPGALDARRAGAGGELAGGVAGLAGRRVRAARARRRGQSVRRQVMLFTGAFGVLVAVIVAGVVAHAGGSCGARPRWPGSNRTSSPTCLTI